MLALTATAILFLSVVGSIMLAGVVLERVDRRMYPRKPKRPARTRHHRIEPTEPRRPR